MNEVVLFFIGVSFVILFWIQIWKRSLMEREIDKLFNLRDEVRTYCINNNIPLDNSAYVNIRYLLNTHIKFVDEVTLFRIIFFNRKINKKPELYAHAEKKIDQLFKSDNEELTKFIKEIREKAVFSIIEYLILSSFPIFFILIGYVVITIVKELLSHSFKATSDLFRIVADIIKRIASKDDYIEELSYYSRKLPANA